MTRTPRKRLRTLPPLRPRRPSLPPPPRRLRSATCSPGAEERFYVRPVVELPGYGGFGEVVGSKADTKAPAPALWFSWSGRFLLTGGADGHVRVRPVSAFSSRTLLHDSAPLRSNVLRCIIFIHTPLRQNHHIHV